jgi:hypothetical protein
MTQAIWMTEALKRIEMTHNTAAAFPLGLHSLCPPPIEYVDEIERKRLADFLKLIADFERETAVPGMYTKIED